MYVCMHVCMHACMHVYYMYIHTYLKRHLHAAVEREEEVGGLEVAVDQGGAALVQKSQRPAHTHPPCKYLLQAGPVRPPVLACLLRLHMQRYSRRAVSYTLGVL